MAWTTPKTWAAELVTVSAFNVQIRDNLNALFRPAAGYSLVSARDYVVAGAGGWTAVDTGLVAGNFQHAIVVASSQVIVRFQGTVEPRNNTGTLGFNISVDGVPHFPGNGVAWWDPSGLSGRAFPIYFERVLTGLAPGAHTFRLDWSANVTGFVLYTSGTVNHFIPAMFQVIETP